MDYCTARLTACHPRQFFFPERSMSDYLGSALVRFVSAAAHEALPRTFAQLTRKCNQPPPRSGTKYRAR